jgi:multidrug efflux system membrane fusion protein
MKFNRNRLSVALSAALLVAGAGGWSLFGHDASSVSVAQASEAVLVGPEVDVANVVAATITDYQDYSGKIEAIDDVNVRPLVSGTIMAVHFKDGALVKKGDLLFTIDQRLYQAAVDQASAQVAAAQSRNAYTVTDAARAERLLAQNAIAKRDYDLAQNAARESVAGLKAAEANLETEKVNLSYTQVLAPISGRVSRAELTVGNVVAAGASAPVLTKIVSVSPIYASFQVDEQTYLRFLSQDSKSDVPVSLGLANESGFSREGKVDSVDNRIDSTSGTIRVRARFDNANGQLVPGLYARVKVGGGAPHQAMMVDDAAVGTDQDKKFVMVVDGDNRAQYREVTLGGMHNGLRIIDKGVAATDRVIVNGLQRARPNDVVKVNAIAMTGSAPLKKVASDT